MRGFMYMFRRTEVVRMKEMRRDKSIIINDATFYLKRK
jgi:hypothetical protein